MPPRPKRARADSSKSTTPQKKAKEGPQDTAEHTQSDAPSEAPEPAESSSTAQKDGGKKLLIIDKDPWEYVCIDYPFWDLENKTNDGVGDEDDQIDEREELYEHYEEKYRATKLFDKPASELPDHKWIMLRKAVILLANAMREAEYHDPDNFQMYVYNDFFGYGLMEMVENFLVEYHKEFSKKEQDLKAMWAQITALGQFMNTYDMTPLGMLEDGERLGETVRLIGAAVCSMLNALDRAGEIKEGSFFKDVAVVIGSYIVLVDGYEDALNVLDDESDADCRTRLRQFARLKNIDLSVVHGAKAADDDSLDIEDGKEPSEWPKAGADRWKFDVKARRRQLKKDTRANISQFKKHQKEYGTEVGNKKAGLGGKQFDITKWTRAERAKYAFDHKDPLKDIPEKELKEGNIMLR